MKNTHVCPKCSHGEVLFIPQLADRDDKDAVRPLVVFVRHFDWKDDMEVGKLQAYICRSCGFTELYTSDVASLPLDKIPGVQVLKGR